MGKRLTGNFDENHVEGFEAMQDDGKAGNYSESVRRASIVGLREMGYINGQRTDTRLKGWTETVGSMMIMAGMVGVGFTLAYPVPARLPSFAVLAAGLLLYYPVQRYIENHEPDVSNKLRALVGGEAA